MAITMGCNWNPWTFHGMLPGIQDYAFYLGSPMLNHLKYLKINKPSLVNILGLSIFKNNVSVENIPLQCFARVVQLILLKIKRWSQILSQFPTNKHMMAISWTSFSPPDRTPPINYWILLVPSPKNALQRWRLGWSDKLTGFRRDEALFALVFCWINDVLFASGQYHRNIELKPNS